MICYVLLSKSIVTILWACVFRFALFVFVTLLMEVSTSIIVRMNAANGGSGNILKHASTHMSSLKHVHLRHPVHIRA